MTEKPVSNPINFQTYNISDFLQCIVLRTTKHVLEKECSLAFSYENLTV